jgi:hypothetical protein
MEELQEFLGLARVVALVILPKNAICFCVNDDRLGRCGPDIQAHTTTDARLWYGLRQFRLPIGNAGALCNCTHCSS